MADQHNSNIPAMGNQISADIPDIKENLEFHKDAFQVIFQSWSDSDNSSAKFDSTTVFSDGTYTYTIPTNGVAGNAKFMIGDSNSIAWFYLNTAPPGWKALATGADMVLAISGGTDAYNVNGGNPDSEATWTQSNYTLLAADIPGHTHAAGTLVGNYGTGSGGTLELVATASYGNQSTVSGSVTGATAPTGGGGGHNHGSSWRPKASVGKLFQLDTA
jgi:hypothetical protein